MLHLVATFLTAFGGASIFLLGTVGVSYRTVILPTDRALTLALRMNVGIAAAFATVVTFFVGTM